jgi:hypothetical protein
MLRRGIILYGMLALGGGIALALIGVGPSVVLYLVVNGAVVLLALLFERGRYRPTGSQPGPWQETEERFVDPSTGQLMMVRYNPRTGARQYVPAPSTKPDQS